MLNKWLLGGVLTVGTIIAVAAEQQHARDKYQRNRQEDCIALAVSTEEKHSCEKEAQSRKDYTPWWNVLLAWPEGITTWAIVATGFAITWQSSETRRAAFATEEAAKASRDAILQQEILSQQWVEISGWRREGFGSTEYSPPSYTIAAEIANPTQAPLTINTVRIWIAGKATELVAEYEVESLLGPAGEPINFTYSSEVDLRMIDFYKKYALTIPFECAVAFTDCFGKRRTQSVRRLCILGPVNFGRFQAMSDPPKQPKGQNPN